MPVPKIIHFTIPNNASAKQMAAIETARKLHPDWRVMVWQDPVPTESFKLSKYWQKARSGAQLADLIRIEAVLNHGGVYLDSDVTLHKPLDEIAENYDFFVASEDGRVVTNAVFGSEAGHPALTRMVDELDRHVPDWSIAPNITTGPCFFSRILKWRKDIAILPRETFYPYNWNEKASLPHPFTYGTHEWEASWLPNRGRPTAAQNLKRYINPLRITAALVRKCEKWVGSNELLSSKTYAYPVTEKLVRKTIHGHSIVLSGSDYSVTPEIAQRGYYELREELLLRLVLRGGDYFIDIGANVGTFSLLAAGIVGPFGRVYSYEPNPVVAEMLKTSATMNWMHERLFVSTSAVGERAGSAVLKFNSSRMGGASLVEDVQLSTSTASNAYLDELKTVEVSVVTLDSEFPCDLPIKFLKIDAEGYEISVLRGADRLLSHRCIDYVMLETIEEVAGESWPDLLEIIHKVCAYGYSPYTLGRNGKLIEVDLALVKNGTGLLTRNLVLVSAFAKNKSK
jgi:FkbM family methyltransferase